MYENYESIKAVSLLYVGNINIWVKEHIASYM